MKNKGYTLAEVLITLAIFGVITVLIGPTLKVKLIENKDFIDNTKSGFSNNWDGSTNNSYSKRCSEMVIRAEGNNLIYTCKEY